MTSGLDRLISVQNASIGIRVARQQLLASNIANADTPNFKASDVDFKAELLRAMAPGRVPLGGLATTSSAHLQPPQSQSPVGVAYRVDHQGNLDGNTVDMDVERAQFAENNLRHDASITFINHLLRSVQQAVQGQ